MTIDTILVKRGALHKGEVGFFPSNPVSEEDIAVASMYEELICKFYSPRNLEALKFLWALVHKTADNTDRFRDKNTLMEHLKIRAGFYRLLWNDEKERFEPVGKSLTRVNNQELRSLTERIMDVICEKIIPGMNKNDLRKEIEAMCKLPPGATTTGENHVQHQLAASPVRNKSSSARAKRAASHGDQVCP